MGIRAAVSKLFSGGLGLGAGEGEEGTDVLYGSPWR